jgi:hypothetical protein
MATNRFKKKNAEKREYKKSAEVLRFDFSDIKTRIKTLIERSLEFRF